MERQELVFEVVMYAVLRGPFEEWLDRYGLRIETLADSTPERPRYWVAPKAPHEDGP